MTKRHRLLLSTIIATCGSAMLAMPSSAQDTAPAAPEDDAVSEVVVTAQKREERLIDVPVTVNVVGEKQLSQQNISSIGELGRAVPALGGSFLGSTVSIRGVSTGGFARSSEEAVSTILDGVVLGRTAISELYDVERVEVLSGPQGMLFGKNASAGVINIATTSPRNEFGASAYLDYGSYERLRLRGIVNIPLWDDAAIRVSAFRSSQDSLVKNTFTGRTNETSGTGGRARFRWSPTDNLEINLSGDIEVNEGTGNFPYVFAKLPTEDVLGTVTLDTQLAACGITASPSNTKNCGRGVSSRTAKSQRHGFSGQIDYTLPGEYVLTSITAKRWLSVNELGDFSPGGDSDGVGADILDRNITPSRYETFSQELRLTSPADQFVSFVAGLYYSKTKNHDEIFQAGGLGYLPVGLADARYQIIDIDQKSFAVFGQATINATDKLSFIVGGRYTNEELQDIAPVATNAELAAILASQGLVYVPVGFSAGFTAVDEKVKEENFSWRLGAQYDFTDSLMVFATAARGYKGPAVADQGTRKDPVTGLATPIIKSEIPMTYEVGLKTTLLDNRVFASVTIFHSKIEDFQTQVFAPAAGVLPAGFVQGNAPYMKNQGVDVSVFGRLFDGFTFNAGVIYTDAEFSSDFLVACSPTQTTGVGGCSAARTTKAVDQVPFTPKWRVILNGEYARAVGGNWEGFIQGDMQFQTKVYTSPTPDPMLRLPEQTFVNGRLGLRTDDGRLSFSVWGRNLLDNQYHLYQPDFVALPGNGRLGVTPGSQPGYLTLPTPGTTVGVSIDVRY